MEEDCGGMVGDPGVGMNPSLSSGLPVIRALAIPSSPGEQE